MIRNAAHRGYPLGVEGEYGKRDSISRHNKENAKEEQSKIAT